MTLLLTMLMYLTHISRISIFHFITAHTNFLHKMCLKAVPAESLARAELQALVCGTSFQSFDLAQTYINTGVIHLFVVSGAHLIFLQKILDFFFKKYLSKRSFFVFSLIVLFLFSAACEFNPPVSRAFMSLALTNYFSIKKTSWPIHFKIFICGLICLCFEPAWLNSISLQLSWLIALGLYINAVQLKNSHILMKPIVLYILILPTLLYFQGPQIYTIFINLLLSPVLEFILFPLALLVVLFNFLYFVFDHLVSILKLILSLFEMTYHFQYLERPKDFIIYNWSFILVLHIILHLHHVKFRRNNL